MFKRFGFVTLLCLLVVPAFGVTTMYWTQTNEADFSSGKLDGVVSTNQGNLKLSRAVKTLFNEDPHISVVYSMVQATDGTIYAGTGPEGVLLAIKDGKTSTVLNFTAGNDAADQNAGAGGDAGGEKNIFSLCAEPNGGLLIGTGGSMGRVLHLDAGSNKPKELFRNDAVQYVWAIVRTDDGKIYAATGPSGKVYEINPDGSSKVLLDTGENNVLCLISDGHDMLYAGTGRHGLVYRINRKTGDSFILYNAAESDVQTLALDGKGNLYAGTAEAKDDSQPESSDTDNERNGHPEEAETGVPIAPQQPHNPPPAPAPAPNPNPGQPNPIPKNPSANLMPGTPVHPIIGDDIRGVHIYKDLVVDPFHDTGAHVLLADDDPGAGGGDNPAPPHGMPRPMPGPGPETQPADNSQQPHPEENPAPTGEPRAEGNAIYKIDPQGFVTEIFRQPVLVMGMIESNGSLLVATGSDGQVYQVNPDAEETVVVAKVEAKQVTSLLAAKDGNIYLGLANVGGVATMSSGYADRGTYTSDPLDATQISTFGKMQLHGTLPTGTTLTVSTRSGNVKEPIEKGWSGWTPETPATEFVQVSSPPARFLEYRLTFTSNAGKSTPVVQDVNIAYQTPNLPPQVKSVKIINPAAPDQSGANGGNSPAAAAGGPGGDADASAAANAAAGGATPPPPRFLPTRHLTIAWDASDPNNDTLQYTLYFRLVGSSDWIVLKDKLTDTSYDWDNRSVADGRYEIKVVASDAPSNTIADAKTGSRISDPVVVDNTPPVIGQIKTKVTGNSVHLDTTVADAQSVVGEVVYSVDSAKDWQFVLPVSNIYDSPEAQMSFDIASLTPGKHQVTLRATDSHGNQSFATVFVSIEPPAAAAGAK